MIHEAFIKPKRFRMITLEILKYAFRYIFEFKTPCCYLNHPQKVILVSSSGPKQGICNLQIVNPGRRGHRRPTEAWFKYVCGPPIAVENLNEDTAHFHILNDRLGSDPEIFDSLFVLRP